MNILEQIIHHKKWEIAHNKSAVPVKMLEQSEHFARQTYSLKKALSDKGSSGIIAEFKRKSPSKGLINESASIADTTTGYVEAGACALSILTDHHFFGGSDKHLIITRSVNSCPLLRKDFIIDEYQVLEAKSIGADAILLIAAVLSSGKLKKLASLAASLGLETILEVHAKEELDYLIENIDIIGVNNRNLKTFQTDINRSLRLFSSIPPQFATIAESGIHDPEQATQLKKAGFNGLLIGEQFMTQDNPAKACAGFILKMRGHGS